MRTVRVSFRLRSSHRMTCRVSSSQNGQNDALRPRSPQPLRQLQPPRWRPQPQQRCTLFCVFHVCHLNTLRQCNRFRGILHSFYVFFTLMIHLRPPLVLVASHRKARMPFSSHMPAAVSLSRWIDANVSSASRPYVAADVRMAHNSVLQSNDSSIDFAHRVNPLKPRPRQPMSRVNFSNFPVQRSGCS